MSNRKLDILITGASTGIGQACARHLATQGHRIWAGVRSEKSAETLRKWKVPDLTPILLDVTDASAMSTALGEIIKKSGILHALVNNAGIAIGGPIEGLTMQDWRRQFDTNVFGLIELTRQCLPFLRQSKGRVVNISSISGRIASPYMAPYAASKFALEAFSDSLRREVSRLGVSVSIVEPGPIATPIWSKSIREGVQRQNDVKGEVREVYGHTMEKFLGELDKIQRRAAPVKVVVRAVEHALTARRPRTRYPVGNGMAILAAASNVIPDRLMDKLVRGRG